METSFLETGQIPHVFGIRLVTVEEYHRKLGVNVQAEEEELPRGCGLGPQVEKGPPFCPRSAKDGDSFFS